MIAHDGVRTDVDSEDRGEEADSLLKPTPTVFVAVAGLYIFAAKKSTANTAGDAVVIGCVVDTD